MSEERAFKGVWIPSEIWLNSELTIYEKAIYAEIDSLDGDKHCWASNEYLAEFCQMSVPTISRAITHLIELGFIERVSFDGRQRILKVTNESRLISEISLHNQEDKADLSRSEFLLYRENKKENNIESTGAGALEISSEINNPRRNFRKEHEVLKDDLQSGKDIDSEKQKKKKSPAERTKDNCLEEINKRNYSEDTKELLREYYLWASSGTDVRKIKSFNLWCSKLDYLEQLIKQGEDARSVVQQSIDKQWYKFESVSKTPNIQQTSFEPLANEVIVTDEETKKREWAKKLESDEGWY